MAILHLNPLSHQQHTRCFYAFYLHLISNNLIVYPKGLNVAQGEQAVLSMVCGSFRQCANVVGLQVVIIRQLIQELKSSNHECSQPSPRGP